MSKIDLTVVGAQYSVSIQVGESIVEALRRANLPALGFLYFDEKDGKTLSLGYAPLDDSETIKGYALRNTTFEILKPTYAVVETKDFLTDIFVETDEFSGRYLLKLDRPEALSLAQSSFNRVMNAYVNRESNSDIQIALSAGGDSRIIAECAAAWRDAHGHRFHAVICTLGFEPEKEHIDNATRIAQRYGIPYEIFDNQSGAELLGFRLDFSELGRLYKNEFRRDDVEIIGTLWLEEINKIVATRNKRSAVIYGYNQEDVIADRLYQTLLGRFQSPYPLRHAGNLTYIAPLCFVPKRVLDSLDIQNSQRNFRQRVISKSYVRSSLYNLAYSITEKFPLLADAMSGAGLDIENPDSVRSWMNKYKN